jgi:hypothetical protein
LAGLLERGGGQQGVIALAGSATRGRKVALLAEQPPLRAPTVGALQPMGVEVALQPHHTEAVVQQVGERELDHAVRVPYIAR